MPNLKFNLTLHRSKEHTCLQQFENHEFFSKIVGIFLGRTNNQSFWLRLLEHPVHILLIHVLCVFLHTISVFVSTLRFTSFDVSRNTSSFYFIFHFLVILFTLHACKIVFRNFFLRHDALGFDPVWNLKGSFAFDFDVLSSTRCSYAVHGNKQIRLNNIQFTMLLSSFYTSCINNHELIYS